MRRSSPLYCPHRRSLCSPHLLIPLVPPCYSTPLHLDACIVVCSLTGWLLCLFHFACPPANLPRCVYYSTVPFAELPVLWPLCPRGWLLCHMWCYRSSRAGLRGQFLVVVVLVKNCASRQQVSTRTSSGNDRRWRQAPFAVVRDKGSLQFLLLRVILRPRGRSWAVAGGLPNQGHQRPILTYIHGINNHCLCPMACFVVRGKGTIQWSRTSLLSFWLLVLRQPQAKYGRCEIEF